MGLGYQGLEIRFGFRVSGFEFWVYGLGFKASGFGFLRIWGLDFGV